MENYLTKKSRIILSFLFFTLVLSLILLSCGMKNVFAASSRALFLSTAGTVISSPSSNNKKGITYKKTTTVITEKPEVTSTQRISNPSSVYNINPVSFKEEIPTGVSVKIIKINTNGSSEYVNPATYNFKTGQKFIVKFETNTPGLISVENISPRGNKTWLIMPKPVEALKNIILPIPPFYFKFNGKPGIEKLKFVFDSCRYNISSYQPNTDGGSSSRSIVLGGGGSSGYGNISTQALDNLPVCSENSNNNLKEADYNYSSSRSISLGGSFEQNASYYVYKNPTKDMRAISFTIKINHIK